MHQQKQKEEDCQLVNMDAKNVKHNKISFANLFWSKFIQHVCYTQYILMS